MGFFSRVQVQSYSPAIVKPPKGKFFFADRTWDRVAWWQSPRLRKLYFYCVVLILNNVSCSSPEGVCRSIRCSESCFTRSRAGSPFCGVLCRPRSNCSSPCGSSALFNVNQNAVLGECILIQGLTWPQVANGFDGSMMNGLQVDFPASYLDFANTSSLCRTGVTTLAIHRVPGSAYCPLS